MTKNNKLSVATMQLNDKQTAPFLVPDVQEIQELAIVDSGVLKYLTKLLPTASFSEIKHDFIERLRDCLELEALVVESSQFVVFHETCNLLKRFFDPKTEVVLEDPKNIVKELTLNDKILMWENLGADLAGTLGVRDMSIHEYMSSNEYVSWAIKNGHREETRVNVVDTEEPRVVAKL